MEAIVKLLSDYALSDAQSDSINNLSLIPFYRGLAIMASEADSFAVMVLNRQMVGTSISRWPRVDRPVQDFTEEGKIALKRLKEQINLRLPEISAQEGVIVILDPLTKVFARGILGGQTKYDASKAVLFQLHREIHKIHNSNAEDVVTRPEDQLGGNPEDNNAADELETPTESATNRRNLPFNLFALSSDVEQDTVNPNKAADDILQEYIDYKVQYNDFLLDGAKKFSPAELANIDLVSLIERFDSMKFLRAHGEKFPTICLLARSLMGKFSNNGFQERVFSVAGNAMGVKQCRMAFSHLEKRTILANNKQLFKEGIFKNVL